MKKFLNILLGIVSLFLIVAGVVAFMFVQDMKPDKEKEAEIRVLAEDYLQDHFNGDFEIYDVLFDNMGNFGFEYAAKARNKNNHVDFLIYMDDETKQLVDTYISKKWAKEVETLIRPIITEKLGTETDLYVYFDDEIGKNLGLNPLAESSYKEFDVKPTIRMTIPRKKKDEDEMYLNALISDLKEKEILKHGTVNVGYITTTGEILEDTEWSKEF
ncbi:hypothetical protein SM124_13835 [Bacillus sp. 31A1R]|uniref:Uncharacterized protein n=1 Tax=Robertmurraya mangrovi TaxID=3098077 RepID=A0ABU5J070_9BACI|nr:hypothetical protein [Bacillus sp. 31A1R]MDZ5472809.1 hypothetical protein [Bacillus sp. 31A1R]